MSNNVYINTAKLKKKICDDIFSIVRSDIEDFVKEQTVKMEKNVITNWADREWHERDSMGRYIKTIEPVKRRARKLARSVRAKSKAYRFGNNDGVNIDIETWIDTDVYERIMSAYHRDKLAKWRQKYEGTIPMPYSIGEYAAILLYNGQIIPGQRIEGYSYSRQGFMSESLSFTMYPARAVAVPKLHKQEPYDLPRSISPRYKGLSRRLMYWGVSNMRYETWGNNMNKIMKAYMRKLGLSK